jgi:excisionase family DNA binding protein
MHTAAPQEVTPEWLRYPEAERYSGLGRSTLIKLISSGEIKAARVGKSLRINRRSLHAYMEQRAIGSIEY